MTDKNILITVIFGVIFSTLTLWFTTSNNRHSKKSTIKNILQYYSKTHQKVDPKVVKQVVDLSYRLTPEVFPNGPFTPKDIITIAMIETDFNPYIVGKYGEIGIWQILDPEGNAFSMEGNCKAALDTLKEKYDLRGNYKMAIIGYNGVSVNNKGKMYLGYWNRFAKARELVERMDQ